MPPTNHNRLATETSPYLLQHKDNPVHWWPWGDEALSEAKRSGKPILLSVGYAACHWCHVMAHESFEDEATAALMNAHFINIKVDREERPDIDAIYMSALHLLGEQGGWPLTMFLDSEARPFWGGTYFPPDDRYGRPSFKRVLAEIARIHQHDIEKVAKNTAALVDALRKSPRPGKLENLDEPAIGDLASRMKDAVDPMRGGFQGAPKFPQFSFFWFLWKAGIRFDDAAVRQAVETTLDNICQGGIYDHIGGGFARYSVDERWLVPHFEKMLYDNALLVTLMTEVWRETRSPLLKVRIGETIAFVLREMTVVGGGFAASYDADSEGEEGKFYVWSRTEIEAVLGADDAALFARTYDITDAGNFEGHNIPNRLAKLYLEDAATEARLEAMRAKLYAVRARRIPPGYDDKVLTDWNGLMIDALAHAARVFERPEWLAAAVAAYRFVIGNLEIDGRFRHAFRAGIAKAPATSADYSNMIAAALSLHEVSGEAGYLDDAKRWAQAIDRNYWFDTTGGYAFTAADTSGLIARTRSGADDATPNANGTMIANLMRLYLLTGEEKCRERAAAILGAYAEEMSRNIGGYSGLLAGALDLMAPQHLVIVSPSPAAAEALRATANRVSLPGAIEQIISGTAGLPQRSPAHGKLAIAGKPTAYFCAGMTCTLPMTSVLELEDGLRSFRARRTTTVLPS